MKPAYGSFHRSRDRLRARHDGKRDGRLGIPTLDEIVHPPAVLQIARRADEALAGLVARWAADDARLRERAGTNANELRTAGADVESATAVVARAEQRREAVDVGRETAPAPVAEGPRVGRAVYVISIVAIVIAEFPLNAIAFRLFGEAEVLTWVMTASLAITLVLCAHGLGIFLRIPQPSMAERRWVSVLVALPILAIVAIAVIRARYLSIDAEVTGLDVLGPVVGSFVFLVINLLIYTGAAMLSYLAHAPRRPDVPTERDALESIRHDVGSARGILGDAKQRARRHEQELTRAEVASEEALTVAQARATEVAAYHRGLMAVYAAANLRARGNPEVPRALRELPAVEIPDVLRAHPAIPEDVVPAGAGSGNGRVSEVVR